MIGRPGHDQVDVFFPKSSTSLDARQASLLSMQVSISTLKFGSRALIHSVSRAQKGVRTPLHSYYPS